MSDDPRSPPQQFDYLMSGTNDARQASALDIVDRLLTKEFANPIRREAAHEIQLLRQKLATKDAVIEHMQACYVREGNRALDEANRPKNVRK